MQFDFVLGATFDGRTTRGLSTVGAGSVLRVAPGDITLYLLNHNVVCVQDTLR